MNIFVSGAGGVAMGPLAQIARDLGWTVFGSDQVASRNTEALSKNGIPVIIGQSGLELGVVHEMRPIDWFVYSSALPKNHPELKFARDHKIKISKRDEFINQLLKDKKLKMLAVAGTHGKTTTTGMLIWIFKQLGVRISYSIGTNLSFGPSGQYQPGSEYFIYEADEYDRNFLKFHPYAAVITSVDYDHPDTYHSVRSYKKAFADFIDDSAWVYSWQEIIQYLHLKAEPNFFVFDDDEDELTKITLHGHDKRNALLAAACASEILEKSLEECIEVVNQFPGTERRFERLGENLFTDYAHHPTEIASTIKLARELSPNVVVVYQPHQNIRQHELMKEGGYGDVFDLAKKVYWLPTYLSRENEHLHTLTPGQLIESLSAPGLAEPSAMSDGLWQRILDHRKQCDLVVGMSAGDLDAWLREKIKETKSKS